MAAKKTVRTRSGIDIKVFEKSIVLNGSTIYNGHQFTAKHIGIIKLALEDAFTAGRNSMSEEVKAKWENLTNSFKVE